MREAAIAIFDLDGSLVETDEANSAAYKHALSKVGGCKVYGLYGRITGETIRGIGLDDVDVSTILEEKVETYCKELWRTRLGPAASALRCVLMHRSIFSKVVLLSDGSERRVMETLRHYGLVRHFDEIVCNGGKGSKYVNYFDSADSNPAACVVWENEDGQVMSAIAAGVMMDNIRKVG